MKELAAGKMIEKKSRFYAHLYTIDSLSDIDQILKNHRSLYKKANHHCYACWLKDSSNNTTEKYQDDGEVGHPGKVLLELLKTHQLTHHVIMISRIFGGIKLGVGGVSKAFKKTASLTIQYYFRQS